MTVLTVDDTICLVDFIRETHNFALRMTIKENHPKCFEIYSKEIVDEANN